MSSEEAEGFLIASAWELQLALEEKCGTTVPAPLLCGSLIDDDWQEAHERLAELEDKPATTGEQEDGTVTDEMDLLGDHEENLAERLTKMVIDNELEDPAIMQAVQTRLPVQVSAVGGWSWRWWGRRRVGSQKNLLHINPSLLFHSIQED